MRFGILGPLLAGDVALTAARDRVVLAMLLLNADRVVGLDELVDAVWGDEPPATARGQLQTCVSRLRRLMPADTIRTDPSGYGVRLEPGDLDATIFARLVANARTSPDPDTSRKLLREALDLWRGSALPAIESRSVRTAATVLDEQRAIAVEDWVDLELGGGRARDLIAELGALVEQFPLRERLRGQLMRALADAGRSADALAEYDRIEAALRDGLGLEPGPLLREARRRVRDGGQPGTGTATDVAEPAVRALPRTVSDFTGRGPVLDRLLAAIDAAGDNPVLQVIDGMAGVGKTTLAVHVAGLVADRYPGAHLFVDLHGHSDRNPVEPGAALTTLLRQLGVPADRIPAGVDDRAALWRNELSGRRALIVLDNAAGSAQVTPLLPGDGASLVLVTSRRRLLGLDGPRHESVEVLTEAEGIELLARIAGERVAAEPEAAAEVVRRCGCLPLAIRLAGARLAHRRRWRVADLLRRLGAAALPVLAAEDRTVTAAFALSYSHLSPATQRIFGLLGLHPGTRFDAPAVAALGAMPIAEAEDVLAELVDLHLVEEPGPGLYRLHDLMREYAARLAADDSAEAIRRLLLHMIDVAVEFTRATERFRTQARTRGEPFRPELVDAVPDPRVWMETHRTSFARVIEAGSASGWPGDAWQLADSVFRFLYTRCYFDDLVECLSLGLEAARTAGDRSGIAQCSYLLSAGRMLRGHLHEALELLHAAIDTYLELGDIDNANRARSNTAGVLGMVGRLDEAWEMSMLAVDGWWRSGVGFGWQGLISAGEAAMMQGRFEEALRAQRLVWAVGKQLRDPITQTLALGFLGQIRLRMGQPRLAITLIEAGMRGKDRVNYRIGGVGDLSRLAVAHRDLGDLPAAVDRHERALLVLAELDEARWESVVCNDYADTLRVAGERAGALELYRRALPAAQRSGIAYEQARAHAGLGQWQEAHAIFERMGVPERFGIAGLEVAD